MSLGDIETAAALADLKARVADLEDRAREDRACIRVIESDVGALRRFVAWLMGGAAVVGFLISKGFDTLMDKLK